LKLQAVQENGDVRVRQVTRLDLGLTLDCGQAFRWTALTDGSFLGVAMGRVLRVRMERGDLILSNTTLAEYESIWRHYFDLDRDYDAVLKLAESHPVLRQAAHCVSGIRVLNQDTWEVLCSFIISQNNHLARIKGIIARFCEALGKPLGQELYDFPTPQAVAAAGLEGLAPLRAGFRAKYLLDAARQVASGAVDLEELPGLSLKDARASLCRIHGVGPKVADCVLLFGAGHADAFPEDVWIRRMMAAHFPDGFPGEARSVGGILQQYLFHCARTGLIACNLQKSV